MSSAEIAPPAAPVAPPGWHRPLFLALWFFVGVVFLLRFWHLGADFTTDYSYTRDGVLYSDEGWYSANAVAYVRTGNWYREGDMNFAVNLPVLQVLHAISFTVLGVDITSARTTIIVCLAIQFLFLYLILRRLADRWTALLAVGWMTTNYFLFLYSRFALGEIPLTMFLMAGFYLAMFSAGPRGWWAAAGAGLCVMLGFYTKNNAAVAFPLLPVAVWWFARGEGRAAYGKAALALAVCGVVFVLHWLLLARRYPEDFAYFHTLNVGANATRDLGESLKFLLRLPERFRLIDEVLARVLFLLVPVLLVLVRGFRRDPLVWFSLAWIGGYMVMLSIYPILRPRYWPVVMVPMAMVIAMVGRHLWLLARERGGWFRLPVGLYGALLLVSMVGQAKMWADYYAEPRYTFAEAAREVKATLDADPDSRNLLLGHFADTVALYQNITAINDRFVPEPLENRLERHRPRYLITESTHEERDYANQWATVKSAEGGLRDRALRKYYREIELIRMFDTFPGYRDWQIGFYRLHPIEEGAETVGVDPVIDSGETLPVP